MSNTVNTCISDRRTREEITKIVRNLKRIHIRINGLHAIAVGIGNRRLAYIPATGETCTVYYNKNFGLWLPNRNMSNSRYGGNNHLKCTIPVLNISMQSHKFAAIAMGWYDDDKNLKQIVSHKDADGLNNKAINLELATDSENQYHRSFVDVGKVSGFWETGKSSIEARVAKVIMVKSKGDISIIKQMYNNYLAMNGME